VLAHVHAGRSARTVGEHRVRIDAGAADSLVGRRLDDLAAQSYAWDAGA
jgi:hypothetical protein